MDFHNDVLETPPAWLNAMEEQLCMCLAPLLHVLDGPASDWIQGSCSIIRTVRNYISEATGVFVDFSISS